MLSCRVTYSGEGGKREIDALPNSPTSYTVEHPESVDTQADGSYKPSYQNKCALPHEQFHSYFRATFYLK
jgi:hypothetical protein